MEAHNIFLKHIRKVWGTKATNIGSDWASKIKNLSLGNAILSFVGQNQDEVIKQ